MTAKNRLMVFQSEETFLQALQRLESEHASFIEAFSPCDLQHSPEFLATNTPFNIVKAATLGGAILGLLTAAAMVWYSAAIDAPLSVGGKPLNSWPVMVPLMWILAVLFGGVSGFASFIWRLRLPKYYDPVFDFPEFELSRNQFYILVSNSRRNIDLSSFDARVIEGGPG
jgi:hypothetical protein